jgi:hypothetical protein
MSAIGGGNCDAKKSQAGANGLCYAYCPKGWSPVDNGPKCAKNCPAGYAATSSTDGSSLACLRPTFIREIKPQLECPDGADRMYDKCILDCPIGTKKHFNLCVPECPPNFVETTDGLSCQAEFVKRVATVREACFSNETRIAGRFCLAPCEAGTVPLADNSEMCYASLPINVRQFFWTGDSNFKSDIGPVVSKLIFARNQSSATCEDGYESINGQCFAKCPPGSTELGKHCVADCPNQFKSIGNQSACLRPTQGRAVVTGIVGSIEEIFKKLLLFIVIILGASTFSSILI